MNPAATLKAYDWHVLGYKRKDGHQARQELLKRLKTHLHLRPVDLHLIQANHDALDAVICVLAAVDFLRGECIQPTDIQLAQKESWIWVREPERPEE